MSKKDYLRKLVGLSSLLINNDEYSVLDLVDTDLSPIKIEHKGKKPSEKHNLRSVKHIKRRWKIMKKMISEKFEVVLVVDDNGIAFQFLVEKERVMGFQKRVDKAINEYYDFDDEKFEELFDEFGIDSVYDYLDYVFDNEIGIIVNDIYML